MPTDVLSTQTPIAYIGIGASAGGLEAITSFLKGLSPNTGCSFVIIQHLSPNHKSMMEDLLARHTDMPVHQAHDGQQTKANHIYLIPPMMDIIIYHGRLLLSEQDRENGINLPIDTFLQSLAIDQEEKSMAVILSGTGSDGVRGLRAVKEHGGLAFIQNAESAKFDGMPKSAIQTGLADIIDQPQELAAAITNLFENKQTPSGSKEFFPANSSLGKIFHLLRTETGVDFSNYKSATLMRRIERRMFVNQTEDLNHYASILQANPIETRELSSELLIGVTRFFRDKSLFQKLRDGTIARQLKQTPEDKEFRVWIAGCSTGEEAYSLAILLREAQISTQSHHQIRIFATDVDSTAIAQAQCGIYDDSIRSDVPAEFLSHYFDKCNGGLKINRSIREMVIFAKHNILIDPPFTQINIISCRNLLIYFEAKPQQKILQSFNFSLENQGLLILGNSETVGSLSDHFEMIDSRAKIYRSMGRKPSSTPHLSLKPRFSEKDIAYPIPFNNQPNHNILEQLYLKLADEYLPVTILVNQHLEIIHIIGDANPYVEFKEGAAVNNIVKLAKGNLRTPLSTGVSRAMREQKSIAFPNVKFSDTFVNIRVVPFHDSSAKPHAALFLKPSDAPENITDQPSDESITIPPHSENQLKALENDLQVTRESLQATIEELETANEELQATNEELLSSNEELQSTNEELQSTNEELYTVNSEHQDKLQELAEATSDIDNLLTSIATGVLILDEDLRIRRFSPLIKEIFGVLEGDIGRPIDHLTHRLLECNPIDLAKHVSRNDQRVERRVTTENDSKFIMRATPFTTGKAGRPTGGVVFTFIQE